MSRFLLKARPNFEFSALRMIVCNQVMKFILDKIEKDEKQAAKKRKKEEVVEQKRSKQNATKLTALLYKHKEQLKAEILKKRALLDKELQLQVQVFTSLQVVAVRRDVNFLVKTDYSFMFFPSGGAEERLGEATAGKGEGPSRHRPGRRSNGKGSRRPVLSPGSAATDPPRHGASVLHPQAEAR